MAFFLNESIRKNKELDTRRAVLKWTALNKGRCDSHEIPPALKIYPAKRKKMANNNHLFLFSLRIILLSKVREDCSMHTLQQLYQILLKRILLLELLPVLNQLSDNLFLFREQSIRYNVQRS